MKIFRYFKRRRMLLRNGWYVSMSGKYADPHTGRLITKKELYSMADNEFYYYYQ